METKTLLRLVGLAMIVLSYALFVFGNGDLYPFVITLVGIISLISPDVLNKLPIGPDFK